jgi:hypothetical protein
MGPYRKSVVYSTRKISSLQDWLYSLCAWVMVVIAERSVDLTEFLRHNEVSFCPCRCAVASSRWITNVTSESGPVKSAGICASVVKYMKNRT